MKLWQRLRRRQLLGLRFQRQVPIGKYIVDFMCYEAKLIVELDGGQHNEEAAVQYDQHRTMWLQKKGYKVIRFWNNDVLMQIENVLENILQEIPPIPTFPRKGGRSFLS